MQRSKVSAIKSRSALNTSPSTRDNPLNIPTTLGQRDHHLPSEHVSKVSIALTAALELLIEFLDQLDEFTGVDVRIARALDVFDDFARQADGQALRGLT